MEKESASKKADEYFDKSVSERERAIFEGAITLGAIYHQFTGVPISSDPRVVKAVEQAIKLTMELQPYKEEVEVKINKDQIKEATEEPYNYDTLKGSTMEVRVTAKYGNARATVTMKHIPGLNYDLMFIERVTM